MFQHIKLKVYTLINKQPFRSALEKNCLKMFATFINFLKTQKFINKKKEIYT